MVVPGSFTFYISYIRKVEVVDTLWVKYVPQHIYERSTIVNVNGSLTYWLFKLITLCKQQWLPLMFLSSKNITHYELYKVKYNDV